MPVHADDHLITKGLVQNCACCGHDTLYIQKDFNRNLGVVIVAAGSLVALFLFTQSEPLYAMATLAVTAAIDLAIYYTVGEVTVCYSCHAIYRGFLRNPEHETFDLKNLEKYGGRDPRF